MVQQNTVIVATADSVYRLGAGDDEPSPQSIVSSEDVKCVAADAERLAVALADGTVALWLAGSELTRVDTGVEEPIESMVFTPGRAGALLMGTEGAGLFRMEGGGVERVAAFDQLEVRDKWHTPWGGPPAVRSLAVTPDGWVYADIHVGSIMVSDDGGLSWRPVTPQLHEDVHQVCTSPAAPSRVYANTAVGVFVSDDRGESWHNRAVELGDRYGRAIAASPGEPDLLLASVSDGPHGDNVHGQLFRSEDAGRSWRQVGTPLPDSTRENINTYRLAFGTDGRSWAAIDDVLYVGQQRATQWSEHWRSPGPIEMIWAL
jgi:hypothetical protein